MKWIRPIAVLAMVLLFALPIASAHTPRGAGDNESLENASVIEDPTKSWAIYAELHAGGEAQYFRFLMPKGERIYVQLFIPTDADSVGFTPGLVIMGPRVPIQGTVPAYVDVPEGADAHVIPGVRPAQATFEPFSPGAFLELAVFDMAAPEDGVYYVAVHEPNRDGRYGLAIGLRESFTVTEWMTTPLSLIGVYLWQGESPIFIVAPVLVTFAVTLPFLWQRWGSRRSPTVWAAAAAGILFLSSGALILTQLGYAATQAYAGLQALVAIGFAAISLLLGYFTLRLALRTKDAPDRKVRLRFAIFGALALVAWSGFLVGPFIALTASVLPSRFRLPWKRAAPEEV